jgi:transmembrane sensor
MRPFPEHAPDAIANAAARWLARRDRGMTAIEQDAYLQWLRENPSHGAAIIRLERAWSALDRLSEWRPAHSFHPNPDLLAPRRGRMWRSLGLMAAAAMIAFGAVLWWPQTANQPRHRQAIIHPGPERLVLGDGSVVELKAGAKVEVKFTPEERRVQLVSGEAHFAVAKDPVHPFIVHAGRFAVLAVGTAFCVSLDQEAVSVLVTEGKVRLDETPIGTGGQAGAPRELSHLAAGQQAVISTAALSANATSAAPPELQVREVTPAEIERVLSWQGQRLEFVDMPLGDVVTEFNHYNLRKLVVGDAETAAILVGGNFRADNVDAFVRLLDSSFGVTAFPRGSEIVLRRTH